MRLATTALLTRRWMAAVDVVGWLPWRMSLWMSPWIWLWAMAVMLCVSSASVAVAVAGGVGHGMNEVGDCLDRVRSWSSSSMAASASSPVPPSIAGQREAWSRLCWQWPVVTVDLLRAVATSAIELRAMTATTPSMTATPTGMTTGMAATTARIPLPGRIRSKEQAVAVQYLYHSYEGIQRPDVRAFHTVLQALLGLGGSGGGGGEDGDDHSDHHEDDSTPDPSAFPSPAPLSHFTLQALRVFASYTGDDLRTPLLPEYLPAVMRISSQLQVTALQTFLHWEARRQRRRRSRNYGTSSCSTARTTETQVTTAGGTTTTTTTTTLPPPTTTSTITEQLSKYLFFPWRATTASSTTLTTTTTAVPARVLVLVVDAAELGAFTRATTAVHLQAMVLVIKLEVETGCRGCPARHPDNHQTFTDHHPLSDHPLSDYNLAAVLDALAGVHSTMQLDCVRACAQLPAHHIGVRGYRACSRMRSDNENALASIRFYVEQQVRMLPLHTSSHTNNHIHDDDHDHTHSHDHVHSWIIIDGIHLELLAQVETPLQRKGMERLIRWAMERVVVADVHLPSPPQSPPPLSPSLITGAMQQMLGLRTSAALNAIHTAIGYGYDVFKSPELLQALLETQIPRQVDLLRSFFSEIAHSNWYLFTDRDIREMLLVHSDAALAVVSAVIPSQREPRSQEMVHSFHRIIRRARELFPHDNDPSMERILECIHRRVRPSPGQRPPIVRPEELDLCREWPDLGYGLSAIFQLRSAWTMSEIRELLEGNPFVLACARLLRDDKGGVGAACFLVDDRIKLERVQALLMNHRQFGRAPTLRHITLLGTLHLDARLWQTMVATGKYLTTWDVQRCQQRKRSAQLGRPVPAGSPSDPKVDPNDDHWLRIVDAKDEISTSSSSEDDGRGHDVGEKVDDDNDDDNNNDDNDEEDDDDDECAICLSTHGTMDDLPHCGHSFHLECIQQWREYTQSGGGGDGEQALCPSCRSIFQ